MYRRFTIPIALLALAVAFASLDNVYGQAQEKVTVDVYYESLCPDSINFIKNQLAPAYNSNLKNCFRVNLIPYGKATTFDDKDSGKLDFHCQHGEDECFGNRAQACALNEIAQLNNIDQEQKMVDVVTCAMSQSDPSAATTVPDCARKNDISEEIVERIQRCSTSSVGDALLKHAGEKTDAFQKPLTFVPTVVINGVKKHEALRNFKNVVCPNFGN